MKVALLFDQPQWTGLGEYAISLEDLLRQKIEDVKLVYAGAIEDTHPSYVIEPYIKRASFWVMRPKTIRGNYKKILSDEEFTGYIFHYLGHDFYPLKLRPGLITIHDTIREGVAEKFGLLKQRKIKEALVSVEKNRQVRQAIKLASMASVVISVSRKTEAELQRLSGIGSIPIHHWIDSERFHRRNRSETLSILNLNSSFKYFLSVGDNRPRKRADLVERFASYLPEDFKLLKIGKPLRGDNVINKGIVSSANYPLYFNCSEGYVHLSDDEGFGLPVIQALGAEVPVICRSNNINQELLGETAITLTENFNVTDVREVVEKLSDDNFMRNIQVMIVQRKEMYKPQLALDAYLEAYSRFLRD